MRLKNVLIVVKNMEESLDFYENILELHITSYNEGNVILSGGLVLQRKDIWNELIKEEIIEKRNSSELYFETHEFDSFVKKLSDCNEEISESDIIINSWGRRVIRFKDPDGNIIEVGEE